MEVKASCLPSLVDGLSVEYEQLQEFVHEEEPVRLDGAGVEEDLLRGPLKVYAYRMGCVRSLRNRPYLVSSGDLLRNCWN